MRMIIFEDAGYVNLLPLVYARATFDLRCGFDALLDKIEAAFGQVADALLVRPAIAPAVAERQSRPVNQAPADGDQLWINGRLLVRRQFDLPKSSAVWQGDVLLAARVNAATAAQLAGKAPLDAATLRAALADHHETDLPTGAALLISYPWQLVNHNKSEIVRQFEAQSDGVLGDVDGRACFVNESAIHVGKGSRVKPTAVLDAENGAICIGDDVTIGPHVTITGPCFIGDRCLIQPGANIAGSSIGPVCKIGGEVEASIFQGYSNKQHDGFLGHSYVGRWVNIGADTITSDLKNTYGSVRVPINGRLVDSESMFVGSTIGDHTKTGINVGLPTGCVIGFASNVFVSRYVPQFVPSFSWLIDEGSQDNDPQRALAVARKVMARRQRELTEVEQALFLSIVEEARVREARSDS